MNSSPTSSLFMRRALGAVQIGLVMVSIYLLTRAAIAFFAPESLWTAPPVSASSIAREQRLNPANLDTRFDPFHPESAAVDDIVEIGTDAPETTLNLKLYGRRAGKNGTAILETPDRTQKVFRIGDEIMNGVILKAVNPDHIVLAQGGRIERLTFERDTQTLLADPETAQAPTTVTTLTTQPNMTIERFMAGVNLSPSVARGQLQGFKLTAKNGTIDLPSLGLASGDVVAAIEDIDLTSPTLNPADIPAKLAGQATLRLTVLRGDDTIYVDLGP